MAAAEDGRVQRFVLHSREEIADKIHQTTPKNTLAANKQAAKNFREYLAASGSETDFEQLDKHVLCDKLSGFYVPTRTVDGKLYKTSSLEQFRYSLNRHLRSPAVNRTIDIIRDPEFKDANEAFKAALRELKKAGKGEIEHYPKIEQSDLSKLYSSPSLNTDNPTGLFNNLKVQFDIRFYFLRRGSENIHDMKKKTFSVLSDPNTGRKYIKKTVDELNKNHNERNKENYTAFMPEWPNNVLCPVTSFEKFITHLHPEIDSLWQKPKAKLPGNRQWSSSAVWYCKSTVGHDTLSAFMTNISKECELSQLYSNHCIRVTGTTLLSQNHYAAQQIMSVTGHRSVNSLAVYQRVSDTEKFQMGDTMAKALGHQPSNALVPITSNNSGQHYMQQPGQQHLSSDVSMDPVSPPVSSEALPCLTFEELPSLLADTSSTDDSRRMMPGLMAPVSQQGRMSAAGFAGATTAVALQSRQSTSMQTPSDSSFSQFNMSVEAFVEGLDISQLFCDFEDLPCAPPTATVPPPPPPPSSVAVPLLDQ